MEKFSPEEWEELQKEINEQTDLPAIRQLENINILGILEMIPEGETWLVCLGRYRIKWKSRQEYMSWWSPKILWWIGKIDE